MEGHSDMLTQQRPSAKKVGAGEKQHGERERDRATVKITKDQRTIAAHLDQIKRLERKCLELQHENAELRHAHKKAFAILREVV
jgi:hypothetical protein